MTHETLLREIELSRSAIRRDYASARNELDFAAKTKRAIASRPVPWLGAAAALGFLLSGRSRKLKKVSGPASRSGRETVKRVGFLGFLLGILRIALPFAKPFLTAYAGRRISELAAQFGTK